jgi:hypothetical protein
MGQHFTRIHQEVVVLSTQAEWLLLVKAPASLVLFFKLQYVRWCTGHIDVMLSEVVGSGEVYKSTVCTRLYDLRVAEYPSASVSLYTSHTPLRYISALLLPYCLPPPFTTLLSVSAYTSTRPPTHARHLSVSPPLACAFAACLSAEL